MLKIKDNHLFIPVAILLALVGVDEVLNFFGTLILTDNGFNKIEIGIILASFFGGALFIIMPAGFISDKIQAKFITQGGLLILTLTIVGMFFTENFWLMLMLWTLAGAGLRAAAIAMDSLYYKFLKNNQRKKIGYLSVYKGVISGGLIFAGGILAAGFFIKSVLMATLFFCVAILIASFFITNNAVFHVTLQNYRKELDNPFAKRFLLLAMVFYFHGGGDNIALPYIWREELGFSFIQFGVLAGLTLLIIALTAQVWAVKHTENTKMIRRYAIVGLLFSGIGQLVMASTSTFGIMFLGRILHLTGDVFFFLFLMTELAFLYSKKTIGGQFGIYTLATMLSGMTSRIFVGAWATVFSFRSSLFIMAGVMIFAAFYIWLCKVQFMPRKT